MGLQSKGRGVGGSVAVAVTATTRAAYIAAVGGWCRDRPLRAVRPYLASRGWRLYRCSAPGQA